jgi:glycosyltransferase involved in cell wall biosynthesis
LHDPELLLVAPVLKARGKVVIYDMHENMPKAIATKSWIGRPLRAVLPAVYSGIERLLLNRMPVVLAEQSYVKDYGHLQNTVVVQNMVLPEVAEILAQRYRTPTVGYAGVVAKERGIGVLHQAIGLVRASGIVAEVECVGPVHSITYRHELEALSFGPSGTFRLHERMAPFDALQLMAKCHIGMALLQPTPNYMDSYPTKLFEYMALGMPIVASDFPLYRDVIEGVNCGVCVDPTDPAAAAEAIAYLLRNPELAQEMGRNGRQAARSEYGWGREAEKLLAFYAGLVASGRRS